MFAFVHLVAALAGLGLATTHQDAAQTGEQDIIVTARSYKPEEVRAYTTSISRRVEGQVVRFRNPVCLKIYGLVPEFKAQVEQRMRQVVKAVGASLAAENCDPNLVLVVADDEGVLLGRLVKAGYYGPLADHDWTKFLAGSAPAETSYGVDVLNEDGVSIDQQGQIEFRPSFRASIKSVNVRSASIISVPMQRVFTKHIVSIKHSVARDKSPVQLADYAAMRALSGASPTPEEQASSSILALFNSPVPALGLTPLDLEYLRALYAIKPTQRAQIQIQQISDQIMRNVSHSKEAPDLAPEKPSGSR